MDVAKMFKVHVNTIEKLDQRIKTSCPEEIDPEKTKYQVRPRCIEFALEKAEDGPYWERLLKEKTKQHWLKVDFTKWKDEDDSDEEAGGGDLEDMMKNMGGLGGGGMPGMGGMGGMPGMGGMGGMPGMGGMGGMPGMGGMGGMPGMGGGGMPGGMDMAGNYHMK